MSADAPRGGTLFALLLGALAIAGGAWFFLREPKMTPRPVAGPTILDERLEVGAGGVARRIRVPEPSTLEVELAPPAGTELRVAFGPAQPVERSPVDAPDPERTTTWSAKPGDPPRTHVTLVPGLYVLRVDPASGAAVGSVALRVRSVPAR